MQSMQSTITERPSPARTRPPAPAAPGAPPARHRAGAPNLEAAWRRLLAASGPAPAPGAPGVARRELELAPWGGRDGYAPQAEVQLPKLQVQKSFPLPTYGPVPLGPVLLTITGRITVKGSVAHGKPASVARFSVGEQKAEFERQVYSSLGTISVVGAIEPGKPSKVGIKFGTELVEVELAAGIDLTKPFTMSVKPTRALEGEFRFGDWTFQGKVQPSLDAVFAPNPAWPGWGAVGRGAVNVARAIHAAGRGLFFAGELGVATTLGAIAVGASVGLLAIGMLGYFWAKTGQDFLDGRALAVRYKFNDGYASTLARLTDTKPLLFPDTPKGRADYWRELTTDWIGAFEYRMRRYVYDSDRDSLGYVWLLGRTAALQDQELFGRLYGPAKWQALAASHRAQYGADENTRWKRYRAIMDRQAKNGEPSVIPLAPVR